MGCIIIDFCVVLKLVISDYILKLIFNKNDPCCFSGNGYETYEFVIKDKMLQLGEGNFQIFIDDTHDEHKISDYILKLIHETISLDN